MNNSNLVDVDFLARFFNKDVRTIQLWAKSENMPKEERGQYDFVKCVKWRIDKLEDKINESMADNNFNKVKVNREFLSEIFNCDVRTVQNYAQHQGMPRDERGEYSLFECLIWYIKKISKDYDELSKDNPLTRARVEAIEINNQKKKKELEILEGQWIEAELVNLVNVAHSTMLMRNLESIAPRLNKKLNGDSKTLAMIREELNDYRNLCADTKLNYYEDEVEKLLSDKESN